MDDAFHSSQIPVDDQASLFRIKTADEDCRVDEIAKQYCQPPSLGGVVSVFMERSARRLNRPTHVEGCRLAQKAFAIAEWQPKRRKIFFSQVRRDIEIEAVLPKNIKVLAKTDGF
jgi:hypothetical protein